eukprot:3224643-Rhodomonas_salina.1
MDPEVAVLQVLTPDGQELQGHCAEPCTWQNPGDLMPAWLWEFMYLAKSSGSPHDKQGHLAPGELTGSSQEELTGRRAHREGRLTD